MNKKDQIIHHIREAFRETEHPGDLYLQGSDEGCEPAEVIAPFKGFNDWSQVSQDVLDANSEALSFFSEGGFRYFLPAFLIADLRGELQHAEPLFHLVNGFSDKVVKIPCAKHVYEKVLGKSAFVNPRRYGGMTFFDYVRCRLSVFSREEAGAIVAYLQYRLDLDPQGIDAGDMSASLQLFWLDRAANAPTHQSLIDHIKAEEDYLKGIQGEE